MKGVELAPVANGRWEKIGPSTTADSVVVKLRSGERDWVIKWSRADFAAPEEPYAEWQYSETSEELYTKVFGEAHAACQYVNKSVELYTKVFGEEYVVPTCAIVGQKKDSQKIKHKVYIVQPFIDGWEGNRLPDLICEYPQVREQWETVARNMTRLVRKAKSVNSLLSQEQRFPIGLTIGTFRDSLANAIDDEECPIPSSPNVIIERDGLQIKLFDFGAYTKWTDSMSDAYEAISSSF